MTRVEFYGLTLREFVQELAIDRDRRRLAHDRDVWAAWYGERFARVERLGLPNEYLIDKIEPRPTVKGRPVERQSIADMKAALNLISRQFNNR